MMAVSFVSRQSQRPFFQILPIILVGIIGLFFSATTYYWLDLQEHSRIEKEFRLAARDRSTLIQGAVKHAMEQVRWLGGLFYASKQVERHEFSLFVQEAFDEFPVQALEWVPRVPDEKRRDFELAGKHVLPDFVITERDQEGRLTVAGKRAEYFPVFYVEPMAGNEAAVGFDLASDTNRRMALEQARDSAELVATERITLVQGEGEQYGFLAILPIYSRATGLDTLEERKRHLRGVVLGVYRLGDMVEAAIEGQEPRGIDILLRDMSAAKGSRLLYLHGSRLRSPLESVSRQTLSSNLEEVEEFIVGGRKWVISSTPAPGRYTINNITPVLVSSSMLLTTLLIVLFMSDMTRRNHRMQALVDERGEALCALSRSEERFRSLVETTPDWIWEMDRNGVYTYVSPKVRELLGYEPGELIGRTQFEFMLPSEAERIGREFERIAAEALPFYILENTCLHHDGLPVVLETSGIPLWNEHGELTGYRGIGRDITLRKESEEQLRLSASVFENTSDGVIISDPDANIISVNKAFIEITGYPAEEVLGCKPNILKSDRHDESFYQGLWASLLQTGQWSGEIWNRRKDGSVYPQLETISAVYNDSRELTHYVAVFSDISGIKESQFKLEHLAHHDPLTKLPNRLLFNARLEHVLTQCRRSGGKSAVLFIDLDGFKNINDSLGHPVGDALLQAVAERLQSTLREEDTVARMGGDEFTIILEAVKYEADVARIAEKILQGIDKPFTVQQHQLHIRASIGISLFPSDGEDATTLVRNSDSAMYGAKMKGSGHFQFYHEGFTQTANRRLEIEQRLHNAVERGELQLYFQPQVELDSNKVTGMEALLRWFPGEDRMVLPNEFLPVCEDSGLIIPVGEWVLRTACVQAATWRETGLQPVRVSVNVSPRQFIEKSFNERVLRALEESGLSPELLELEITESVFLHNPDEVLAILTELKSYGVRMAIDDFGTGYSSLSYLKRLPFNTLKIDQIFIRDITRNSEDAAITSAAINMAHSLGMEVVAEGAEAEEQVRFLKEHNCDIVQGYFFSRPLPASEATEYLQEKKILIPQG